MHICFDIEHFYYLPQYLPIIQELTNKNNLCTIILYKQDAELKPLFSPLLNSLQCQQVTVSDKQQAHNYYLSKKPDWIFFGNKREQVQPLNQHSKTVLMQHGIGPKSCYYDVSDCDIQYRFVEGQHRLTRLQQKFPHKIFVDTGFAKLDPIVNRTLEIPRLEALGLDPTKKTLLYAPTFYPSSIELMGKNFPEKFSQYNIIIKPHYFSYLKKAYSKQRKLFNLWQQYSNVYFAPIEQVSILPYYAVADLLLSEASSTLFEFAALNKPVIWCDFYKLRWSYRGILKYRFKQRLDDDLTYFDQVAARAQSANQLTQLIDLHITTPELKQAERQQVTEQLVGRVDGKCSQRIIDYITQETN